jgi:ribosomal-protein-alanine N-acetyltransferase
MTVLPAQSRRSNPLILRTPHLEIVAATLALIETEVSGPKSLAAALNAEVGAWPPPMNDESSLRWTVEKLKAHPDQAGFYVWYVILTENQQRRLIGLVGVKGPPDEHGSIEVGYSIVEEFQRQGIGTEATRALIDWAFDDPAIRQVTAETFPDMRPSIRVMERCGMHFIGESSSDPGAIRYGITREQYESRPGS